jgi:hypothetical protein
MHRSCQTLDRDRKNPLNAKSITYRLLSNPPAPPGVKI